MGLRWKVAIAMALVALGATVAVGTIVYRSTSERLINEIDRSISQAVALLPGRDGRLTIPTRGPLSEYGVRALDADGAVVGTTFDADLPVGRKELSTIDTGKAVFTTVRDGDASYRVQTIGVRGGAVQVARSLEETDRVLDDLRTRTVLLVLLVSLVAALLGWMIAGTVVAPLRRLTRTAEDVAASGELDVEVPRGSDEVGRLGVAFGRMLDALSRSQADQRRLVEDAGHELRTPLTSLRTNLAVLQRHPDLPDDMRRRIFDDIEGEVTELTDLVNEVVTAASGGADDAPAETLALDHVAAVVAERVGRRRGRTVEVVSVPGADTAVRAPRLALERAIGNLIENACKFDSSGAPIEVRVDGGTLTVLDRGPGVAPGEETLIFERFHRTAEARTLPGSGLGLAIVRDIVERADGTVRAEARPGGGLAIGFTLPADLTERSPSSGAPLTAEEDDAHRPNPTSETGVTNHAGHDERHDRE